MPIPVRLIKFRKLTREGTAIPKFEVIRRALKVSGEVYEIGTTLPTGVLEPRRLKQLYEQRMIRPIGPVPIDAVGKAAEKGKAGKVGKGTTPPPLPAAIPAVTKPVATTPAATPRVPSVAVPVSATPPQPSKSAAKSSQPSQPAGAKKSGGYTPTRRRA